ncbi:Gfo/Idh/MocA family oxidoreductase [Jiella sp. MQZ9-1]|uniref:Gfo/Idh/MocA family oxidoreductase n=1 Tax=Jiella flava TaxID=2816857 RepID=A0A939JUD0_9HYPH|nr:Gfo/Idh/MocA family oxidoreductase [Jiella flava]MBO0661294.1 Gfo/Idh/MocA family oxidoreductase [Jiella flava]MCD2469939.1 Gfo/Idh/MocA family oxidoreductase [Jiella flava]
MILGTGSIAHRHAEQFLSIPGCRVVAACDINAERAQAFANLHGIPQPFADLNAALAWGQFDAVVNATPDAVHKATTLKVLRANKAVFCEKPLALNAEDAFEMVGAAERARLINMVNLTYRNAHAIQLARRMVEAGEIGVVRHVSASYRQSWLTGHHWGNWQSDERWLWRLSSAHGSKGVIGDIGIHILDFATYGTGLGIAALQARLQTFDKAEGGAIGAYPLDANDSCAMTVEFDNGALGVVHMSRYATGKANDLDLTIHGTTGALKVWSNTNESSLDVCLGADIHTQTWRRATCPPTPRNADRFAAALLSGMNGEPDFRHAAKLQTLLDLCFASDAERRMLPVVLPPV